MLSNKTKIGIKRLYFLILLFIFSFPSFSFAFTWHDVLNSYNSCIASKGATDACWVEEVATNNGNGYQVWKRKDAATTLYADRYYVRNPRESCVNCYTGGTYACDGKKGITAAGYYTWYAYYQNDEHRWVMCDGNYTSTGGAGIVYVGSIMPECWVDTYYYIQSCKVYDTLLAAFIPTDKCLNKLTNTYEPCAQNCKDPVNKTNAVEICNDGIDNNCNGEIDEGCKTGIELPMMVYQCADGVGTKTYDTTDETICNSGCSLAAMTMVLNYYLNNAGLPMIDVLSLNEWLNKNNGYADKPETPQFDGLVDWFVISLYPNSPIRYDDIKSSEIFDIDTKTAILNSELMDGFPIILKVKTLKGTTHFVVATGINGTTWDIIDPGHQDAKTTLAERYKNTFYGIRVYKPRQ